MRDVDHDFDARDDDRVAIAQMPNESAWQPSKCPTCSGPCEARVTGLRLVAETGDETMAGTERRSTGIDPNSESALLAALATLRSRRA